MVRQPKKTWKLIYLFICSTRSLASDIDLLQCTRTLYPASCNRFAIQAPSRFAPPVTRATGLVVFSERSFDCTTCVNGLLVDVLLTAWAPLATCSWLTGKKERKSSLPLTSLAITFNGVFTDGWKNSGVTSARGMITWACLWVSGSPRFYCTAVFQFVFTRRITPKRNVQINCPWSALIVWFSNSTKFVFHLS